MAGGEIRNQEAELVAAEPRVQIARARARPFLPRVPEALLREEVVAARLLAQQRRDALDDPIADGMAERVVVPLEAGDIDEADRAPPPALLERKKRLQLLGEAAEVHQLRFRIAVRLVGEVGDERLEVARDAADGRVARGELG